MLGEFLVVFIPDRLKLPSFLAVLIDLLLELVLKLLDRALKLFDLRLLEVKLLEFESLGLVLLDLLLVHAINSLLKLSKGGFVKWDLLAAVPLLLLELDLTSLSSTLTTGCSQTSKLTHGRTLHEGCTDSASHCLLLGHRWIDLELVVNRLNDGGQRGRRRVPVHDSWPLVLDCHWVERWVSHRGHHMNFGRHLGEQVRQSDLDIEGSGGDCKLERDSMLRVLRCLSIHNDLRVHLTKLVELDVRHGSVHVVHLLWLHLLF